MVYPDGLPLVLKAAEVARVLRISKWQVHQLIDRGEIRALRLGRCIRVSRDEVLRLLGPGNSEAGPTSPAVADLLPTTPGEKVSGERKASP